jgi:uncharacterized membrane protein YebE (DUF533 family)
MKQITSVVLAAAALVFGVGLAAAQPAYSQWDQRETRQYSRSMQGRAYGELTRAEMRRIREGQRRIQMMERLAMADGHISRRERYRIRMAQQEQSALIWRLRHNDRRA